MPAQTNHYDIAAAIPAGTRVSAAMGWDASGQPNPRANGTIATEKLSSDRWAHVRWDSNAGDLPNFVPAYSLLAADPRERAATINRNG